MKTKFLLAAVMLVLMACGCTREYDDLSKQSPEQNKEQPARQQSNPPIDERAVKGKDSAVFDEEIVRLDGRAMDLEGRMTPGALGAVRVSRNDVAVRGFDQLDGDGDGDISYSEAKASPGLRAVFGDLDRDKNGMLDPEEFARFKELNVEEVPKSRAKDIPND